MSRATSLESYGTADGRIGTCCGPTWLEAPVHADGYRPGGGKILTPCQLPIRREDTHSRRQLEGDSTAEIQGVRADEPIMIASVLIRERRPIVNG